MHEDLFGHIDLLKVIAGVSKVANIYNIPLIALCGYKGISQKDLEELGITASFSIVPGPVTLEESIANTQPWLMDQVVQIMNIIKTFSGRDKN